MSRYKRNVIQNAMETGNVEPQAPYVFTEDGETQIKKWYDEMTKKFHYTRDEMESFLQVKCREDYDRFMSRRNSAAQLIE